MRRLRLAVSIALVALAVPPARAADEAFLKAAVVVGTFDHYAGECRRRGSPTPADATTLKAWEAEPGVAGVRARLPQIEPAQKQQLDRALAEIVRQVDAKRGDPCAAAAAITRTPEARLATAAPPPVAAPNAGAARPAPTPPPATGPDPAVLAQIDSFGFDMRMTMGVGGFLTGDVYPVVLFRDGQLLEDVEGLLHPGGLAAHRREYPKRWTRWRRQGGELQLEGSKGWKKLTFQVTYAKLPDGLRLDGTYRRLSGGGTVAVGGNDSVAAWSEYHFGRDGRVTRGGGMGGHSEFDRSSVATRSLAANRTGSYRIDGLMLRIRYDDGSEEARLLITDPKDPTGAIWLDGRGYAQSKR